LHVQHHHPAICLLTRKTRKQKKKKEKRGHNLDIYIYTQQPQLPLQANPPQTPPPLPPKKKKKKKKNFPKSWTDKQMMDDDPYDHIVNWTFPKDLKKKLHQWGCCMPSHLTSTTLGGLPSLPSRQFTKFQQTSWACYEQDLSLYIYFNLFYAFSPLMSLCLVEGPIPPTRGKKNSKKKKKKTRGSVCNTNMRSCSCPPQ
jgi:hypothetical protein